MNYFMPCRLYTGDGCVVAHQHDIAALGNACLVVTGGPAWQESGAMADVKEVLTTSGIQSFVWTSVRENPTVASCIVAGASARNHDATFIVGVGGGSALDAAKAVAVFAANPTLDEQGFYDFAWENDPLPIVLIGTTAGTGSEVTKVSVLTDAAGRKHSIHDDRLYATIAFGDGGYTHSCPASVTLSCGVDVLAHAVESYFSRKADEISRAFAARAVRLAIEPLGVAARGATLDAAGRTKLYEASILGGLAINTTGTCFPHNVGYYLTESYHVPHGFASAAFMGEMLDWVGAEHPDLTQAFSAECGISVADLKALVESCLSLDEICMSEEEVESALPRWENNGSVKNTLCDVSQDMLREMLMTKFVGK